MQEKVQLPIGGMTCVQCRNKIQKELNRTRGVIRADVSYEKGRADILYDPQKTTVKKLEAAVEKLGYRIEREQGGQAAELRRTACLLAVIVALYALLQATGVLNLLVPSQLAETGMGYGMLFVIGLLTSVHCIAMCGGINLAQCIPRAEAQNPGGAAALRPALLYNLGRVACYTAVGGVLGLVGFAAGGAVQSGPGVLLQGILKMAAGVCMIVMGVNMLGLFPGLRRWTIRTPRFLARRAGAAQAGSRRPFYVGLLNGFMPCGPLQSMWIVALAAGTPLAGALSLFFFALGTVPLMLGLGSAAAALGRRFTGQVMTAGAVLVTVLGLAMLAQGGALSGWLTPGLLLALAVAVSAAAVLYKLPAGGAAARALRGAAAVVLVAGALLWGGRQPAGAAETGAALPQPAAGEAQEVHSTLEPGRYPDITVQAGVPVRWVIDVPEGSLNGCNYRMLIPGLGLTHTFSAGENVIEFTAAEANTLRYSCWMGMLYGSILVTDGPAETSSAQG